MATAPAKTAKKSPARKPLKLELPAGDGLSRLDRMRARLSNGGEGVATVETAPAPAKPEPIREQGRRIVPIDKVIENPGNERKTFRGMDGIKATIEAFGILEPPTVEPQGDGTYLLVTGHRRTRAAREVGLTEIEVLVRDPDAERVRRRKSIVSNVQHQDVDAIELAEGLQTLLDEDETITSQAELAAAIGKSRAWVSETLGILRLRPDLQVRVRNSEQQLPYDAISKIAREDEAFQEQLIDDLLNGAGVVGIRAKIAERKEKGGKPTNPAKAKPAASAGKGVETPAEITLLAGENVSVILRSMAGPLTSEQQIAALRTALAHAEQQAAPGVKQAA